MPEPKIITMRDVQPEQVKWLWKPYIPLGKITVIQGDGGDGKTTTATAIAAAVSRGDALPGSVGNAEPAHVILQNAEDGLADTIVPRLTQFGADIDRVHFIDEDERELSLTDERLEKTIIRTEAKLCVLDPIQAYLGGANMNSANGVRPLMKKLGAVASRTECAILLVGHLGKKGGRSQYRGLGSVDIPAAARSVLTIGRIDVDENMRAIVHNKSNLAPPGPSLAFGLDPVGGFCWLGEYDITIDELLGGKKNPESQFAKARRLIETALANGPVLSADMMQMAEEQGISAKTLNRAKDALGVISIKRGERWYWELPIEVEYTVIDQDGQHGQDGQDCQSDEARDGHGASMTNMTTLTIFQSEAV